MRNKYNPAPKGKLYGHQKTMEVALKAMEERIRMFTNSTEEQIAEVRKWVRHDLTTKMDIRG